MQSRSTQGAYRCLPSLPPRDTSPNKVKNSLLTPSCPDRAGQGLSVWMDDLRTLREQSGARLELQTLEGVRVLAGQ
jgi:hypothetical protein